MLVGESLPSAEPDFHEALQNAIDYAVSHQTPNLDARQAAEDADESALAELPQDFVIELSDDPPPASVSTTIPDDYIVLLRQTQAVLHEVNAPDEPYNPENFGRFSVTTVSEHELAHGDVMRQYGNSQTIVRHGIVISVNSAGVIAGEPYTSYSGPLRKIHNAWASLAPESQLSPADKAIVIGLGLNPADREDIRRQAELTPRVEEDWIPYQERPFTVFDLPSQQESDKPN
jgi:hypothetical protein